MVDAAASKVWPAARGLETPGAVSWQVSFLDGEAFAAYQRLASQAQHSPSQSPAWIAAWQGSARPDCFMAMARSDGKPVIGLVLEVVRQGPFKMARFLGGHHACGNFAPVAAAFPHASSTDVMEDLLAAIRAARPDVDGLALERIAGAIGGTANPLLALPHLESPNIGLVTSLAGGFDALLGRASGKRKKKKNRWQTRKFEAAGPFRRFLASTPDEVNRVLDAFFEMKRQRLAKKGIVDVFGEPEVQAFFRDLFTRALADERPAFMLHAFEVAGKIRAVTGSSIEGRRLVCEFGGMIEDELSSASPGDYLFFDNIREACEQGFEVYDFSIGDEPYKRLWCDTEIAQFDAYVALSMRGQALAALQRAQNRAKSFVKNNPVVWKLTKALRKRTAAVTARDDED
jgi:CelD/BcsL family acetyltransferase involved in cellulose biosynthesis